MIRFYHFSTIASKGGSGEVHSQWVVASENTRATGLYYYGTTGIYTKAQGLLSTQYAGKGFSIGSTNWSQSFSDLAKHMQVSLERVYVLKNGQRSKI